MRGRLDIDFEHFAVSLLGQRYYQFCNWSDERAYKKFLKEVAHQLKRVINSDFQSSDKFQLEMINRALKNLEECFKKNNYEAHYIKGLIRIIFWILGDYPNNWQKKNLRGKKICYPKHARTLLYSQSKRQKVYAILQAHKYYPYAKRISFSKLFYKLVRSKSDDDFLNFYKKKYQDLYLKLF